MFQMGFEIALRLGVQVRGAQHGKAGAFCSPGLGWKGLSQVPLIGTQKEKVITFRGHEKWAKLGKPKGPFSSIRFGQVVPRKPTGSVCPSHRP